MQGVSTFYPNRKLLGSYWAISPGLVLYPNSSPFVFSAFFYPIKKKQKNTKREMPNPAGCSSYLTPLLSVHATNSHQTLNSLSWGKGYKRESSSHHKKLSQALQKEELLSATCSLMAATISLAKSSMWEITADDIVSAGLSPEAAAAFHVELRRVARAHRREGSEAETWKDVVERGLLNPSHPHKLHQLVYYSVYAKWDASARGPPPYWFPSR